MLDRRSEFPDFTERGAPSGPTPRLASTLGLGTPTAVCERVSSGIEGLEGRRYFLSFLNRSILWWDAREEVYTGPVCGGAVPSSLGYAHSSVLPGASWSPNLIQSTAKCSTHLRRQCRQHSSRSHKFTDFVVQPCGWNTKKRGRIPPKADRFSRRRGKSLKIHSEHSRPCLPSPIGVAVRRVSLHRPVRSSRR